MDFYGKPEIFNSDQGSQFTSSEFIAELRTHGIQISMDGRGRCLDNAKMERFWWALKYEDCGCPRKLDNLTWCKMPVK